MTPRLAAYHKVRNCQEARAPLRGDHPVGRSNVTDASSPPRIATLSLAPRIDVRVVLFTVSEGEVWVALGADEAEDALPAGLPLGGEALDEAAIRILAEQVGAEERYLEQLYSIAHGEGDSWSVTIAYLGITLPDGNAGSLDTGRWARALALPNISDLDNRIIHYALLRLRAKLGYTTIAFHLLPRTFTMTELQHVYEAVLDRRLDKRNFRRRMQAEGILEATAERRREGSHRPARLFKFRAGHDAETYLTPAWEARTDGEPIAT